MNICQCCGSKTKNPKYCSSSCSAKVNNQKHPKRAATPAFCSWCKNKVRRGKRYCGPTCHAQHAKSERKKEWYAGTLVAITNQVMRNYLAEDRGYKCEVCGVGDWQGKPITLQLDHKDGDPENNTPENVRLLCPNCHSQTENWGAKKRK
jgi:5-methylcytosine-specific restriction endonuclease McrA